MIGQRFGPFEIVKELGRGGMGTVYQARDTRLQRVVALKFLNPELVKDEERLARFEQEARSASALNHPNIITIYDVGVDQGTHFIATEFVAGQTLRQLIHSQGRMDIGQTLNIAIQTAEALLSAHEAGITHRDIKPDNIMLRNDGYVKVLDFGLAKLSEQSSRDDGQVENIETHLHTVTGIVMGTTAYMSPEQLRGMKADGRSDIFSLGVTIYEMVTGRRPFEGVTSSDIIAAILGKEPRPISELNQDVPKVLQWILSKTLRKDQSTRYQSMKELLADLKDLKSELTAVTSSSSAVDISGGNITVHPARINSFNYKKSAVVVVAALLLLSGYLLYDRYEGKHSEAKNPQPAFPFGKRQLTSLTTTGDAIRAAITPDGKYIIVAGRRLGKSNLRLIQISTSSSIQLLPYFDGRITGITTSPDNNHVYYVVQNQPKHSLFRIPLLGGSPTKILEDIEGHISFSPDAARFTFLRKIEGKSAIMSANSDGSDQRVLFTEWPNTVFATAPAWSTDGNEIAIITFGKTMDDCYVARFDLKSGRRADIHLPTVGDVGNIEWVQNKGWLVSVADDISSYLYQLAFFPVSGGALQRLTTENSNYRYFSLARSSNVIATIQESFNSGIWTLPPRESAKQITFGKLDAIAGVAWTPDGRIVHGNRDFTIWITDPLSGEQKLLNLNDHTSRYPCVSPDGGSVAFESWRDGDIEPMWRMNLDGGGLKKLTNSQGTRCHWSADGKWIVFSGLDGDVFKISSSGGTPELLLKDGGYPGISPDSKLVASYVAGDVSAPGFAIVPIEGESSKLRIIQAPHAANHVAPRWIDDKYLAYVAEENGRNSIRVVSTIDGKIKQFDDWEMPAIFSFDFHSKFGVVAGAGAISGDVVVINDLNDPLVPR